MLEANRDGRDIVVQVSAVSRALDRAGFAIVAGGSAQCLRSLSSGTEVQEPDELFLSLA